MPRGYNITPAVNSTKTMGEKNETDLGGCGGGGIDPWVPPSQKGKGREKEILGLK